jgi:hypothetical protein
MRLPVIFLPEAEQEFKEAITWYAKQKKGLGKRFAQVVKRSLKAIQATPNMHAFPHDHEQIDVALIMWLPAGVGAKQNDLVRLKALGDAARKTANCRQGDVRRGVSVRLHISGHRLFFGHVAILQQNPRVLRDWSFEFVCILMLDI